MIRAIKTLTKEEEHQREERDILKRYLNKYLSAKHRRDRLQERLDEYTARVGSPTGGQGNGGVQGMSLSHSAVADLVEVIESTTEDLREQIDNINVCMFLVNKIIGQLGDSQKKDILEMKYLDELSEEEMLDELYVSRSTLYRITSDALDDLLKIGIVRRILANAYPGEFYE